MLRARHNPSLNWALNEPNLPEHGFLGVLGSAGLASITSPSSPASDAIAVSICQTCIKSTLPLCEVSSLLSNLCNTLSFENDLNDPRQSAYQKYHSTETALVKVHNDIMEAIDGGSCVILVLFDLSTVFETVDHEILLHRLEKRLGVTGSALLWFKSYLSSHMYRVYIKGTSSDDRHLK